MHAHIIWQLSTRPARMPLCPSAGQDIYRYLPNKTLQLFKYALSSPCKFTHIMKTDDDVYIRWVVSEFNCGG